jgi:transcriptional regulator with XRE-family HTH domain
MAKRKYDPSLDTGVNDYVGQRIKLRRDMLGLTQKDLAAACGVTFQQIQKYETGETRIVAEKLYLLGLALEAPVSFLFAGLPNQTPVSLLASIDKKDKNPAAHSPDADDPLCRNESLELIKLYWGLPNDGMRTNIINLLRGMK